ncbi:proline dehydrogenase family protein [Bacteroidia bacterium]|nr:proline dehydrogenase family protein [Bacteroidia bacterium]
MNLSFDNTEVAFAHKSNRDLKKAYRLFQTFNYPFLVNNGPKLANLALSLRLPIKGIIKNTLFAQFCGGESISESYISARQLHENGIGAILDYSVEGEGTEEDFILSYAELQKVIHEAANKPEYPIAVFKCTAIANFKMLEECTEAIRASKEVSFSENIKYNEFNTRMKGLCQLAYKNNVKLLVDAEETWIQDAIDEITYEYMALYNKDTAVVYNTIQLYRKGRIADMQKRIETARQRGYKMAFKLVRGAYMEKESERARDWGYDNPIQDSKQDTDDDYDAAIKLCFDNRDVVSICAGTHNEKSSLILAKLLKNSDIEKNDDRFWFAQLYGMSDHISYNLAASGYNVAKYLPYGPIREVLPYLSRRAQENSSVKGQAGRELSLIQSELKRRKLDI